MITIKNSDIRPILSVILLFDATTMVEVAGLLTENIPLSFKRKLQKIREDLLVLNGSLDKDLNEVNEKYKDDIENLNKEVKILMDEVVQLNHEPISIGVIESIQTKINYPLSVIEKFAT